MATFYNQATLSYNGNVTNSNIISGELLEVLSATKTAVMDDYTANDDITYVISIINSGATAFTGLTITDNLGSYAFGLGNLVPLTYATGSVRYYINGVLQTAPTVTAGPPLVISGIDVPANGNAMIMYEVNANSFAPLGVGDTIVNEAEITGGGLSSPLAVTETISTEDKAVLTISKAVSPSTVTENGQLTYTFTIQNSGNTAAVATDNVILTDTFDPILDPIAVTFNSVSWSDPTNYSYNSATGEFTTVAGEITVPPATYTQDAVFGNWIINPGVSTLVITGTV
ncbi:hypothetical protein [Anaerotignum sp. MB30-C6]|uniref:hypothetical protein n=1 Tax=Anaerotignum sp. MB30-C6 TaxID=3070814 RepID=UPI0027DE0859|nr:hypothetical protein [Anaerotignum sp. MB30-C6]WMI80670.1 hypothetical protein RBQ60_12690 [Anaerotignum sp. MB30-C6]